jgi:hypothetical protein|tara:strand:+ start:64 stop:459 length:396 start_codon:yes stop_codon:yes gene_type:complete
MIAIAIGIIFVVVVVATVATVFLMNFNNTKRIKALKSEANSQSKVMIFTERDYKGVPIDITVEDDDNVTVNLHVKSFMIPSGYKFKTFPKSDQMGSAFTYPGPAYVNHTDKTIASFIVFKGMLDGGGEGDL